jgi:hypothetical protein
MLPLDTTPIFLSPFLTIRKRLLAKRPNLLTGASSAVKGPVSVFRIGMSGQGKVFTAVFADTEALLTLHAFPHKKVDDIVNVLGIQHFGKGLFINHLKAHGLELELKCV